MSDTVAKIIVLVIVVIFAAFVASLVLMLLWGWVIPDVFGGAVTAGVLPASITLWQAFKLSLFFWLGVGTGQAKK